MKLGKNLFSVIVLVAIGCLLLMGIHYFTERRLRSLSVTNELLGRFKFLVRSGSYLQPLRGDIGWDNGDGYTIRVPSAESFFIANPQEECSLGPHPALSIFRQEISVAQQVFAKRGFVLDLTNSSAEIPDFPVFDFGNHGDYVQAYQKDDKVCVVRIPSDCRGRTDFGHLYIRNEPDHHRMRVSCANMSAYADARKEQLPFLEALELRNTSAMVRGVRRSGQFFSVNLGSGIAFLKKEVDVYRVLTVTQEMLPCSLVDKEQIPHELLHSDPARCECLDDSTGRPRGCT